MSVFFIAVSDIFVDESFSHSILDPESKTEVSMYNLTCHQKTLFLSRNLFAIQKKTSLSPPKTSSTLQGICAHVFAHTNKGSRYNRHT